MARCHGIGLTHILVSIRRRRPGTQGLPVLLGGGDILPRRLKNLPRPTPVLLQQTPVAPRAIAMGRGVRRQGVDGPAALLDERAVLGRGSSSPRASEVVVQVAISGDAIRGALVAPEEERSRHKLR